MKAKRLLLTLALCFAGTALSFAQSPQMGTWKLDEAKSKIPAGFMKNTTVIYATDGDNVKVTTDGTGGDGKPISIDGLWSLTAGNGGSGGDPNKLYFTAGPQNETHGLFGSLGVAPGTTAV